MKTMLVYSTKWIMDKTDEKTGEIIEPAHNQTTMDVFELDKVLRVKIGWNSIELLIVKGNTADEVKIEDVTEIYYR